MNCPIFISYSRKDSDIVHPLVKEIEEQTGAKCWIDLAGIESGEVFSEKIANAINAAKIFLFMYTAKSEVSEWTKKELYFAKRKGKKNVIVKLENKEFNDWFELEYGITDTILISDPSQKQKLFRNLRSWLNVDTTPKATAPVIDEAKIRAEIEAKLRKENQQNTKAKDGLITRFFSLFSSKKKAENTTKANPESPQSKVTKSAPSSGGTGPAKTTPQSSNNSLLWDAKIMEAEHLRAEGKEKAAFGIFMEVAKEGSAHAQYMLGYCYEKGVGIRKDECEAYTWYKHAQKNGYQNVERELVRLHSKSTGLRDEYGVEYGFDKSFELTKLLSIPSDMMFAYEIREGTTQIAKGAFANVQIETLTFPSTMKNIGGYSFEYAKIHHLIFKEGVQSIKNSAFRGSYVKTIQFPSSLKTICQRAFENCIYLRSVNFGKALESIGDNAFHGCCKLKGLQLPDSLKTIETDAFRGCENLNFETITLPYSLEEFGMHALEPKELLVPSKMYETIKTKVDWSKTYISVKQ